MDCGELALRRFGRNEVRDLRRLAQQPVDVLLQHAIGVGHALVLAQVLEPRLDEKGLEEPAVLGGVFVDAPGIGSVAAARRSAALNEAFRRLPAMPMIRAMPASSSASEPPGSG
jgi:hypothetical protein